MNNMAIVALSIACIVMAPNLHATGANDAETAATQFLQAYQSKDWNKVAEFIPGSSAQTFASEESLTSGWRWRAVSDWNGTISGVRYHTYEAANGKNLHTAYAKFGELGDECFIVTMGLGDGNWYIEEISSPDCSEFYSYSNTSEAITAIVPEESQPVTYESNTRDRDTDTDTEKPISEAEKEAYARYVAAYNKLTDLMAQGKGDSPRAQGAFENYQIEKQRYEKFLREKE